MASKYNIYNFYGKLIGSMDLWAEEFPRIKKMGFNWVYFNPICLPGKSKSDYSVKDYYKYNPLYIGSRSIKEADSLFKQICLEANANGLQVMLDIVINHTAIDSDLIKDHDSWYMHDAKGNLISPSVTDGNTVKVWDDLAEIDNVNSKDKKALWDYWKDYLLHSCSLGVTGFRCDAAYMVPFDLWKFLINEVHKKYPKVIFLGETLGCSPEETKQTALAGFNLIMNGFKWWDYKANWFPEQFNNLCHVAPSMSFPENHDTVRCAEEVKGNKKMQVMRYALCALICTSVAITTGFEYGFMRKIDVYNTTPEWFEKPSFNIEPEIKKINALKAKYKIFNQDNKFYTINFNTKDEADSLFGFTKNSLDNSESVLVVANTSLKKANFKMSMVFYCLKEGSIDVSYGTKLKGYEFNDVITLSPGEVKVFYKKNEAQR